MQEIVTHESAAENFRAMTARVYALFAPPEDITVSQWAEKNRVMPKGTSSRPGPFRAEIFQVELMNVVLDPRVRKVVFLKSTQIGFSDAVLNNIVGFYVDIAPRTILLIQPTIQNASDYGKKRLTPMIQSTPSLRAKIKDQTSRRSGNTLLLKHFPGGFLKLTGANSGTGLRSDAINVCLLDEVDGWPLDVSGEG
ncbi:MAG: phage terminase large subunit family protein [Candidatus Acidiferrales bacterium]